MGIVCVLVHCERGGIRKMKQIFDWLREQIEEKSVEVNNVAVVSLHNAIVSVNRAQLKWEADCCEWKRGSKNKDILFSPHEQVSTMYETYLPMYPYCSVCGKPIKISEVE
jgi:hypothetical protein